MVVVGGGRGRLFEMARPWRLLRGVVVVLLEVALGVVGDIRLGFSKSSDRGQIVIGFTNTCGFTEKKNDEKILSLFSWRTRCFDTFSSVSSKRKSTSRHKYNVCYLARRQKALWLRRWLAVLWSRGNRPNCHWWDWDNLHCHSGCWECGISNYWKKNLEGMKVGCVYIQKCLRLLCCKSATRDTNSTDRIDFIELDFIIIHFANTNFFLLSFGYFE